MKCYFTLKKGQSKSKFAKVFATPDDDPRPPQCVFRQKEENIEEYFCETLTKVVKKYVFLTKSRFNSQMLHELLFFLVNKIKK